jgi:hypothetical protein
LRMALHVHLIPSGRCNMSGKQTEIIKNPDPQRPGKQTDLAEGELETVEESIRIHQQKGDLNRPNPKSASVPKERH